MVWFVLNMVVLRLLHAVVRGAAGRLAVVPRVFRGLMANLPLFARRVEEADACIDNLDLEAGIVEPQTVQTPQDADDHSTQTNSHEDDDEDGDESDCDPLEFFADVLAVLSTDRIPDYALAVRQRLDPQFQGDPPKIWDPVCGSYNICFSLGFDDGVEWMIKFPVTGTKEKWTDLSASALTSEAKTMIFLKKETTIPLPEVFDFCASPENELNCPYIIMSYIDGRPLSHLWFGDRLGEQTREQNEEFRLRVLRGVAAAMKQLSQFSFNKGGFLEFDEGRKPTGVGPMRVIDWEEHKERLIARDENTDLTYIEVGPFEEPEDQYKSTLYLREEKEPLFKAMKELISHLVGLVTENSGDMFDLAHPDLAVQNVIVSKEGELRGIIDWDGVAAVPMSRGSRAYPLWLRQDWDFGEYQYDEETGAGIDHGLPQDSPEKLKEYRRLYAKYLVEAHPGLKTPLSDKISLLATKASLVTVTLHAAATQPLDRVPLLRGMMEKIDAAVPEDVELDYFNVCHDIEDEIFDDDRIDELEDGYAELLEKDL